MGERGPWTSAVAVVGRDFATRLEGKSEDAVLEKLDEKEEEEGGGGLRLRSYRRSELEGMRFADVDGQRRRWSGILGRLEPVVVQEYYQLEASNHPNRPKWNEGRRQNLKQPKEVEMFIPAGGTFLDGASEDSHLLDSYDDSSVHGFKNGENSMIGEEEDDGEFSEEDEDIDDEYSSIQKVAFCVEGEPDFESGPPQDGLEYLKRVRWEAAQIPNVKVARFDKSKCSEQTTYMPSIPDIPKCPEKFVPLKCWKESFIIDFSKLRETFSRLANPNGMASIDRAPKSVKIDLLTNQLPTVRMVLKMDPLSRATTLKELINEFENATTLSREKCSWIFALCVAVDTPFDAEMSATMRCLLRKSSSLLSGKTEFDDEVVMLNILVVISGKCFGQSER